LDDPPGAIDVTADYRFYGELAEWWPLVSPPDDYREEAAEVAELLRTASIAVGEVLELGSGGGHNAYHLKDSFSLTLVDLSPDMLGVSGRLNPECTHIQGDMRSIRLGRTFDAVFVHDAIDYMITEADLRTLFATAFLHTRPGGIALFMPDHTAETYQPSTDHGGVDDESGRGVRYLEWSHPPAPDGGPTVDYAFLLRDADGVVRVAHETHHTGLFGREVWLRLLTEAGFEARSVVETTTEPRGPREFFVGSRPPT
jgi:SAM-dependent methyltransferase